MNKFISAAALAAMALGFAACDGKDDPKYTPAEPVADAQRVFFRATTQSEIVDPEQTSFDVMLYRPDTRQFDDEGNLTAAPGMGELTVELIASCSEADVLTTNEVPGIITVPATVTFAENSPNATITVGYKPTSMTGNKTYKFNIAVGEANADLYGIANITVSALRSEYTDWAPFAVGGITDKRNGLGTYVYLDVVEEFGMQPVETPIRVMSRSVPTDPNDMQFEFQRLVSEGADTSVDANWVTFRTAYTKDGGKVVFMPEQFVCEHPAYGDEFICDTYYYTGSDTYKGLSKFDPVTGVFTFNVIYYDADGLWNNPANEYVRLNGYVDTNVYEMSISDKGQINMNDVDYSVINFTLNENVNYAIYTIVKQQADEELTEEQIAEIAQKIQDPDQTEYTVATVEQSGNITLDFDASGTYTIVAVGYKADVAGDEAKCTATCTFTYTTFNPYEGWTKVTDNGTYTETLFAEMFKAPSVDLPVSVYKSDKYEGDYMIANPYVDYPYLSDLGMGLEKFGAIYFTVLDGGKVIFPLSDVGVIFQGNPVELLSYAAWCILDEEDPMDPADLPDGLFGTFDGTKLTMDASTVEGNNGVVPSFVCWAMGKGPYTCNMPFALDLGSPAAKPAKRANALKAAFTAKPLKTRRALFSAAHFTAAKKATARRHTPRRK